MTQERASKDNAHTRIVDEQFTCLPSYTEPGQAADAPAVASPAVTSPSLAPPSAARESSEAQVLRLSEVLSGMSYALDLTEGQRAGHSVRSALLGMRLAEVIGLPQSDRSPLFYALLMKDLGCSSNAARFAALFGSNDHDLKADLKIIDWSQALESFRFVARNAGGGGFWLRRIWHLLGVMSQGTAGAREVVLTRCERGAEIAKLLSLPDETALAIRSLDEHWDGRGQPFEQRGTEIPQLARILGLSQTFEVFFSTHDLETAFDMAVARRGTWFEPALVDALFLLRKDMAFWRVLAEGDARSALCAYEPEEEIRRATPAVLDGVAEAFARVIDAKSPWTYDHSRGVADLAVAVGRELGLSAPTLRTLRQAGLLHDLGKLGVSNLILDKPGKLTPDELEVMRRHPRHTADILARVSCFDSISSDASAHHERVDGRGYHLGLPGGQTSLFAKVLCVADVCEALSSSRPYRPGKSADEVLNLMGREIGTAFDPDCFRALSTVLSATESPGRSETPAARLVPSLADDYIQAA